MKLHGCACFVSEWSCELNLKLIVTHQTPHERNHCKKWLFRSPGFWDTSEARIWVVSVDDTRKVTPHIRPVEGLEAVFDGKKFYNMAKKKEALQRILGAGGQRRRLRHSD